MFRFLGLDFTGVSFDYFNFFNLYNSLMSIYEYRINLMKTQQDLFILSEKARYLCLTPVQIFSFFKITAIYLCYYCMTAPYFIGVHLTQTLTISFSHFTTRSNYLFLCFSNSLAVQNVLNARASQFL